MPHYQFVVSEGRPKPASRRVRSHAMRTALHRKVALAGKKEQQNHNEQLANARLTENLKSELHGKFRLVARPGRARKKQDQVEFVRTSNLDYEHAMIQSVTTRVNGTATRLDPSGQVQQEKVGRTQLVLTEQLGSNYLDPFSSICIPYNNRVDVLIKYFLHQFTLNISKSDTRHPWFAFSMQEPLIMHTTLALAGTGLLYDTLNPDLALQEEVIVHKGSAIETINSLLNVPTISDTLIAGVANVANVAAFEGSFSEADTHLRGLKKLIDLRGGYETFVSAPLVTRAVTWADLQTATAQSRVPLFPLVYKEHMALLSQELRAQADIPSLEHVADSSPAGEQIKRCFILLRRCQMLVSGNLASPDIIRLHMHIADTFILNLLFDRKDGGSLHEISRTLLLAAHVFLYVMLRKIPRNGAVARVMLHRLEASLQGREAAPRLWNNHLTALLWVLFVGAAACKPPAGESPEPWRWVRLRDVFRLTRPTTKESLVNILKGFLWSEEMCGPFLNQIWRLRDIDC